MQAYRLKHLAVWRHPPASGVSASPARCLVLHGLGEHSARHLNTVNALVGAGYETVRFDFRGCGESEGERQWVRSFDEYVEDVDAVCRWAIEAHGPKPLFVIGHSLGGAINLHAAAKIGEAWRGIVLLAPAFEVGEGISALKILVGKAVNLFLPHFRIPEALDATAISRDQKVVDAYRADPLNCPFNTVRQGNEILKAMSALPEVCQKIRIPALLAHGEADRLVKVDGSRKLHNFLASPDKLFVPFPGAFHELHNDLDREAFFRLLVDWLNRRSGSS